MKTVIYIHGKGGTPDEAEVYAPLFAGCDVVGMDYSSVTPWQAAEEFPELFGELCSGSEEVILIANSIGAFFAMHSLSDRRIKRAFFISPVADMENLIINMMYFAGVTESELHQHGEIVTDFGETLSWEYLCYVRENPINWDIPTDIICGGKDTLISTDTFRAFADRTGASLTIMPEGEHWFHTPEQMKFLKKWLKDRTGRYFA